MLQTDIPWMMWPCAVIATWHLTEVLRHGSIFEPLRAYADLAPRWMLPIRALACPFCTSHWAALAALLALCSGFIGHLLLIWLTTVRIANVLNDVLKPWCRTPGQTPPALTLHNATLEDLEREYIKRTGQSLPI